MSAPPPIYFAGEDAWDIIRLDIEREYWEICRANLPDVDEVLYVRRLVDLIYRMADAIEKDMSVTFAMDGEWDFQPLIPTSILRFELREPPRLRALRAVARRELREYNWEVMEAAGGECHLHVGVRRMSRVFDAAEYFGRRAACGVTK